MQDDAYCADLTVPMRVGVECVCKRTELQRKQQQP